MKLNNTLFEKWLAAEYSFTEGKGYYKMLIPNYVVYYSYAEVLAEYNKLKEWFMDPTENGEYYRKFRREYYEKYF